MVILKENDLAIEIRFHVENASYFTYHILFTWQGQPIINDAVLKRSNEWWDARGRGVLVASEGIEEQGLITVIEQVLDTNEPAFWEPDDPDVIIAFYPEQFFPFIRRDVQILRESEDFRREREDRRLRKAAAGGKLPDDLITVIVRADVYNFKDCSAYQGSGIALTLATTRAGTEQFLADLRAEHAEAVQRLSSA